MAERFFNTTGPVVPADHHNVPPLQRFDLDEVLRLIGAKRYFVLHAPRQTGKTSALLALRDLLNEGGEHRCVYANVETGQTARGDVAAGMRAILAGISEEALITLGDDFLARTWERALARAGPHGGLRQALGRWSLNDPVPLVLLIDEIDALVGDTLISVLRQLRAGYVNRPAAFPQAVVLCGIRDVRDYRIHSESSGEIIAGGSAFNIKAASLRLGDFHEGEVRALLGQHTEETGQEFTEGALSAVWNQSRGQPWLVNALADEACFQCKANRDRSRTIDEETIMEAREELILSRQTHLHQLTDKLQEERLRRVVEPILSGGAANGKDKAGPQLLLQAFLQRVVNGGGRIEREYALGSRRTDLLILWPPGRFAGTAEPGTPARRYVVECKILRGSLEATIREGLERTLSYMDKCRGESGHLVIFDRDGSKPWEEKIYRREESLGGRAVTVWGA